MLHESEAADRLLLRESLHPSRERWLRRLVMLCVTAGFAATIVRHGLKGASLATQELGTLCVLSMALIGVSAALRFRWSLVRTSWLAAHRAEILLLVGWIVGVVCAIAIAALKDTTRSAVELVFLISELAIVVRLIGGLGSMVRDATAHGFSPPVLLACSFLLIIAIGTGLLMLPEARNVEGPDAAGAPFDVALFTAASASCVTGLIVVDTPEYWSRTGHVIILCLFQIGAFGIMTFGAMFGLVAGRGGLRAYATLQDLLESEGLGDVRRLLIVVALFTLITELIGAVLLSGLWADLPWYDQIFYSVFHAVSGFCNAGFALHSDSFLGAAGRWQVWGVLAGLIIVGGIGFSVIHDMGIGLRRLIRGLTPATPFNAPNLHSRLSLSARLVLATTFVLLVGGTIGILLLERTDLSGGAVADELPDAWFQSVTLRTAGFNTVEMGALQPATKLLAIALMFIGASPGSTGGGIKTVTFAIAMLGLVSILNGRRNIECLGRTIPDELGRRALAVIMLAGTTIGTATMLLLIFEQRPDHFLDYLFEAVSAVGTVGVSSSVQVAPDVWTSTTFSLSAPSRFVIIMAMYLGRIGPLTLLLAVAGQSGEVRYEYPSERVMMG